MARSSFNKTFKSVDLPEFGLPTMATATPFFITFPFSNFGVTSLLNE